MDTPLRGTIIVPPRDNNRRHHHAKQRELEALEIQRRKILGHRDVEIARDLKISTVTLHKRLNAFVRKHGAASVDAYRHVVNEQIDVVISAAMIALKNGDMAAASVVLKGIERKQKLMGLDAPEVIDLTVQTQQEKELADLLAQAERDNKMREDRINGRTGDPDPAEAATP